MQEIKINNVVICYNNPDEVVSYAKELANQSVAKKVRLVIVINKATQEQQSELKRKLEKIAIASIVYTPGENLGYLNGLVYGYKKLDKVDLNTEWTIFSNTDIVIPDSEFLSKFLDSKYYNNHEIWAVGPSVYAINQEKYSNPYKINRTSKSAIEHTNFIMRWPHLFHFLYTVKSLMKKRKTPQKDPDSRCVYAIHGSYMFLRQDIIRMIVSRDPWELLYNEESYIAEIARSMGKAIYYDSDIEVNHTEGTSTGTVNIVPRYKLMRRANQRIIDEFY